MDQFILRNNQEERDWEDEWVNGLEEDDEYDFFIMKMTPRYSNLNLQNLIDDIDVPFVKDLKYYKSLKTFCEFDITRIKDDIRDQYKIIDEYSVLKSNRSPNKKARNIQFVNRIKREIYQKKIDMKKRRECIKRCEAEIRNLKYKK